MTDIRAFVEARVAEDELWAKAASADRDGKTTVPGGVHWTWAVGDDWEPVVADPLEPYMGGYDGQWSRSVTLRTVEEWPYSWGGPDNTGPLRIAESEELRTADGAHIVRHDPARVLRDVEVYRLILAQHQTATGWAPDYCAEDTRPLPCPTLRALASIWAGHADYQAEWKP